MASRGNAVIFKVLSLACLSVVLGCGARTDTLFDDGSGLGGYDSGGQGQGGGQPTAGGFGNTGNFGNAGGFGNTGNFGNAGGFGNTGNFGNAGGFGNTGNFGNTGGTAVAGSANVGGAFPTAGTSSGGFGAFAGSAAAGGSGGIVDLCVSAAPTSCDKCQCQACGSELSTCFSDLGCALIFACAEQKQCQGFGCYQNSTCRSVIDQFGGLTGAPVAEVFALATCAATTRQGCGCN